MNGAGPVLGIDPGTRKCGVAVITGLASVPLALEVVINGYEHPLQIVLSGHVEPATDRGEADGDRSKTLDVIMDIDLPLVVRFGRTELPLKALTALGPGSVIDLGRSPDEGDAIVMCLSEGERAVKRALRSGRHARSITVNTGGRQFASVRRPAI